MDHVPIHELIGQACARFPDRVAIERRQQRITYRQLAAAVGELAAALVAAGAAPGSLVGILADDSAEVIAGMLGCLAAGCAFVPVDPGFQVARLEAIAKEARPRCWLAAPRLAGLLERLGDEEGGGGAVIPLDVLAGRRERAGDGLPWAHRRLGPDDLAYVYFTSGSSGRPKGIAGRLKAIDHYVRWMTETFQVGEGTRFSQLISPAWDGFMLDAFVPAAAGGTVCVPDDRETLLDGSRLRGWIDRQRLHVIHCTPSLFRQLLRQDLLASDFAALRTVLLVGEPLLPADVKRWTAVFGDRVQLVNLYGPSETTLTKLFYLVRREDAEASTIPIGKPMPGARAIVVDDAGRACPPGRVGEIYLRTPYRSLGYLNQPEATARVFVPNPFSSRADDVVYKTGDLGRIREDGNLEFLGRGDGQVKIRGMRIELAPIEEVLRTDEQVAEAAVAVRDDPQGYKFLCAYVVPRSGAGLDRARLAGLCRNRLAAAMVPSAFVALPSLPRTATGKLDRQALPDPAAASSPAPASAAPRRPLEQWLSAAFCELLGIAGAGVQDSFFELGGHSLLAMQLLARIRTKLGVALPLRQIFETPTVAELAAAVEQAQGGWAQPEGEEIPPLLRRGTAGEAPLSFAQQRIWVVEQLTPGSAIYNLAAAVQLDGELEVAALRRALAEIVRRHESLRTAVVERGGDPAQVVLPPGEIALPLVDLTAAPPLVRRRLAEQLVGLSCAVPFDLGRGRLLRCTLLRLGARQHVLASTLHHIAGDVLSQRVLVREVGQLYGAFVRGADSPLPELPLQYSDYAVWQRRWLQGARLAAELAYWRQRLAGAPTLCRLPTDRPRSPHLGYRGAREPFALSAELTAALKALCRQEGCTLFQVLLAAFQVLIGHASGQPDVVVGTPVADRDHGGLEGLIGLFLDTLAVRTDLSGDPTFQELLARVRRQVLDDHAHRHLPFETLVAALQLERSASHHPLFQVTFNFVGGAPDEAIELPGLTLTPFAAPPTGAQFDLSCTMYEAGEVLAGSLLYRSGLFERRSVTALGERFCLLLSWLAETPGRRLSEAGRRLDESRQHELAGVEDELTRISGEKLRAVRRQAVAALLPAPPPAGMEPAGNRRTS
jgi:amino acid adenylation domain-containing protein